jgi:predicted RNA methylase
MGNTDVLLALLLEPANEMAWSRYRKLEVSGAARIFVQAAFSASVCEALIERYYVIHHRHEKARDLDEAFAHELRSLAFLRERLSSAEPDELEVLERNAENVVSLMILMATHEAPEFYQAFARAAVHEMARLCQPPFGLLRNSLYRTFDVLDELFGLDYRQDQAMDFSARAGERIFAGAGRGVQSSYLSLFLALNQLPRRPSLMIDLGSGYGRVGLVAGLFNSDWSFQGYEYVEHRVRTAQNASERLGLNPRVRFSTQNLSASDFELPAADVYYLYDPFSKATYERVLLSINKNRLVRRTLVVAKGGALQSFQAAGFRSGWQEPEVLDDGHLGLFLSF